MIVLFIHQSGSDCVWERDKCIENIQVLYKTREIEFCEKLKIQMNKNKPNPRNAEAEATWQNKQWTHKH